MAVGDLNKKFGWVWLLLTPLMGMFITFQFGKEGYGARFQDVTIAGETLRAYMGESFARSINRLFHAHSGLLAVFNILFGMSIDEAALVDNTKKLGGILAIAGTVLVSLSFGLFAVRALSVLAFPFRIIGSISVIAAIAILAIGMLKK